MDQHLLTRDEEHPKTFGQWRRKGEHVAATSDRQIKGECWNCGEKGHISCHCKKPKVDRQQAAASSASSKLVALQAQLKAMEERIAALTVAREAERKEGF